MIYSFSTINLSYTTLQLGPQRTQCDICWQSGWQPPSTIKRISALMVSSRGQLRSIILTPAFRPLTSLVQCPWGVPDDLFIRGFNAEYWLHPSVLLSVFHHTLNPFWAQHHIICA